MLQDLPNTMENLIQNYESELIWLGILISLLVPIIDRQRRKRNKRYLRIKGKDALILPLKPHINWPMTIVTVLFAGTGLVVFVIDLANLSMDRDSWAMLGLTITIIISLMTYSLRRLSLQFVENEIAFNHVHYKASEIRKMELWDDLIFVVLKDGQKEKIWLRFHPKRYEKALEIIKAVELFCIRKNIPFENNFALNIEDNEVFNPVTTQ